MLLNFPPEALGWAGSAVLLATLVAQIARQCRAASAEAVSPWLFLGQMLASATFFAYSLLIGNAVFMFTNALLVVAALTGQILLYRRRRRSE